MAEFVFAVILLVALLLAVLLMPSARWQRRPRTDSVTRTWMLLMLFLYIAAWLGVLAFAPVWDTEILLTIVFTLLFLAVAYGVFRSLARPSVFDARAEQARADWGGVAVVELAAVLLFAVFIFSLLHAILA